MEVRARCRYRRRLAPGLIITLTDAGGPCGAPPALSSSALLIQRLCFGCSTSCFAAPSPHLALLGHLIRCKNLSPSSVADHSDDPWPNCRARINCSRPPVSYVQKAATAISAGISASVEVLSHSERIFRYAAVGPADGAPGDLYLQNSCSCRDGARVRYIRSGFPVGTGEPASTLHCRAQATGASGSNTVPRKRSSKNPAHGRVFFCAPKGAIALAGR